ncbi:MAG: cytochrome-c peroxidase, partial [Myxococcaceae bacterium]
MHSPKSVLAVAVMMGAIFSACGNDELVTVPESFPKMRVPEDNALTRERVELGKRLFFDERLSRTGEVSCASCHKQENAFADPRRLSEGVEARVGTRNAPPLFNLAWNTSFFWDGGVKTLEQQVIGPIMNPLEMDMQMNDLVRRLNEDDAYVRQFEGAYDSEPSPEFVTKALSS